jgi:hypothetical protein
LTSQTGKQPAGSSAVGWQRGAAAKSAKTSFNRSPFFLTLANNAPAVYVRVSPLSAFHESNFYMEHRNCLSTPGTTTCSPATRKEAKLHHDEMIHEPDTISFYTGIDGRIGAAGCSPLPSHLRDEATIPGNGCNSECLRSRTLRRQTRNRHGSRTPVHYRKCVIYADSQPAIKAPPPHHASLGNRSSARY